MIEEDETQNLISANQIESKSNTDNDVISAKVFERTRKEAREKA